MKPSLSCALNCGHCYLPVSVRRSKDSLSIEQMTLAVKKIDDYYQARNLPKKEIVIYWYGGEITDMGIGYVTEGIDMIDGIFTKAKGYECKHVALSSLVTMKEEAAWFDLFKRRCDGRIQTSYDGTLRGRDNYVRQWEGKVRAAQAAGLQVSTLSVVTKEFVAKGPAAVYDYLCDLGIVGCGFLTLLRSANNVASGSYAASAPTMVEQNDFLIGVGERYVERMRSGLPAAEFGSLRKVWEYQTNCRAGANTSVQTLFLLPNSHLGLLDYEGDLAEESIVSFGSILENSFEEILHSPVRRAHLRRQKTRNGNPECQDCEKKDSCLMEFWKNNPTGDECFGSKRFVEWVERQPFSEPPFAWKNTLLA